MEASLEAHLTRNPHDPKLTDDFFERPVSMHPANDWCQRWRDQRHSWRHKDEGGFDPDRYTVEPIDELTAKRYVEHHHYSGSYPAASVRHGLFDDGDLVGVAVFGIPVQTLLLTNTFPELAPFTESLELSRFVLDDACPGNSESWMLARCFEDLASVGVRGVVSCSDPVPRIVKGEQLFAGHIGTIYQASNAIYTGRLTARTLTLLPDGTVFNDRSMQKVRRAERGHGHVERKLVDLGARAPRAGEDMTAWLHEAMALIGVTKVRHRGNYRYAFPIGTKRERRDVRIAHNALPYPKEVDKAA